MTGAVYRDLPKSFFLKPIPILRQISVLSYHCKVQFEYAYRPIFKRSMFKYQPTISMGQYIGRSLALELQPC